MARNLMSVLAEVGDVELVSTLRSRDGAGDKQAQAEVVAAADAEIDRLIEAGGWDAWVTYHNYYKAPDVIGPAVCAALNIPYHIVEASRAQKRLTGPWADFAKRAEAASDAADVIYYFTQQDYPSLKRDQVAGQRLVALKPFLNWDGVPAVSAREKGAVLLAVGMFRAGDKVASYTNLARALAGVTDADWSLNIIGSGAAEGDVRSLFEPFEGRVHFLGELPADQVLEQMALADVFVWPGVNEAFGMVYLEAQASGLPVVAEDRPGVRDVVGPDSALVAADDADAFAAAISDALANVSAPDRHQAYVSQNHLRGSAVKTLRDTMMFKGAAA